MGYAWLQDYYNVRNQNFMWTYYLIVTWAKNLEDKIFFKMNISYFTLKIMTTMYLPIVVARFKRFGCHKSMFEKLCKIGILNTKYSAAPG